MMMARLLRASSPGLLDEAAGPNTHPTPNLHNTTTNKTSASSFRRRHLSTTTVGVAFIALLLLGGTAPLFAAAQTTTPTTTTITRQFKTCYLLFGGLNDLGYTYSQNLGRITAHRRLSQRFPDTEIVSVAVPGAFFTNHTETIQGLVDDGCNVIHATAAGFIDSVRPFVFAYPNVTFSVHTGYYETSYAPNVITFAARGYKPWYVAGRVAAKQAGAGSRIGFVAAWSDNPELVAAIDAFTQGVADEDATLLPIQIISTQSWYAPDREAIAVEALRALAGCSIVAQFTDSFVAAEIANARNDKSFFSIQMHGQATRYYGDAVLTCVYSDWSFIFEEIEGALLAGQRPRGYIFSDEVARLCDVSSRAPASTIRFAALANLTTVPALPQGITDAQIRNMSVPDAARARLHTPMPNPPEFCRVGTFMTYDDVPPTASGSPTTQLLGPACVECPENTESTETRIACTPCVDGLIAARGAGRCVVPPSEAGADVGAIVGGVLASAVVMIVVFIVLAVLQSRRHASSVRDTTFAPRTSPATLMFTDIEGSTSLWCEDPDAMSDALDVHNGIMREAIKTYGAYEVKTAGDSFMIACSDPLTAVKLSVDIQQKILAHQWSAELPHPVRVRIGFAHGPVDVVFDEQSKGYDYYGPTVNLAARCEAAGDGGQTFYPLDTPLTTAELTGLKVTASEPFERDLRGIADPVKLVELLIPDTTAAYRLSRQAYATTKANDSNNDDTSSVRSGGSSVMSFHSDHAAAEDSDAANHPLVVNGAMSGAAFTAFRGAVAAVLQQTLLPLSRDDRKRVLKDLLKAHGASTSNTANFTRSTTAVASGTLAAGRHHVMLRAMEKVQRRRDRHAGSTTESLQRVASSMMAAAVSSARPVEMASPDVAEIEPTTTTTTSVPAAAMGRLTNADDPPPPVHAWHPSATRPDEENDDSG